jgi:hypothetical protein
LRVLHELGAGASLSASGKQGETPAHGAAIAGHEECLRVLHELRAGASLSDGDNVGHTPAHGSARNGHGDCLRVLHEVGAGASLSASGQHGENPAHVAARYGHEDCLRVLHELGAGASLSAGDENGHTPAHVATKYGHADCLRVLQEVGAGASLSTRDENGHTPAHGAAIAGHEDCLRVLHEVGAGASLTAVVDGWTVAHYAAEGGHVACLRALHECFCALFEPIVAGLRRNFSMRESSTSSAMAVELEDRMVLAYHGGERSDGLATPAATAVFPRDGFDVEVSAQVECYRYLDDIGGATKLLASLAEHPSMLRGQCALLLTEPGLLDLKTKQAWLVWQLKQVVGDANAAQLMLVSHRANLLDGLCAQLGVDEQTGRLIAGDGASAFGIDVRRATDQF